MFRFARGRKNFDTHMRLATGRFFAFFSFFSFLLPLFAAFILSVAFAIIGVNLWVVVRGDAAVLETDAVVEPREFVVVLGAGVKGRELSGALKLRMMKAISLYHEGRVTKILVSGDGTDPFYNETLAMKHFAVKHDVPAWVIYEDPHGYSTYASVVRAKHIFNIQAAYIVSQRFHLSRAVWLANALGMNSLGIAPAGTVQDEWFYRTREIPARVKDFLLFGLGYFPPNTRSDIF